MDAYSYFTMISANSSHSAEIHPIMCIMEKASELKHNSQEAGYQHILLIHFLQKHLPIR